MRKVSKESKFLRMSFRRTFVVQGSIFHLEKSEKRHFEQWLIVALCVVCD